MWYDIVCAVGITTDEPRLKEMRDRITNHAITTAALQAHGIRPLQSRLRSTDGGVAPAEIVQEEVPSQQRPATSSSVGARDFVQAGSRTAAWPAPSNFTATWVTLPTPPILSRQEKKNEYLKQKRDATANDPVADKLRKAKESAARQERRKRPKPNNGM